MTRRFDPADIPASPDLRYESERWANGCTAVAGLDEAGRGAWAGPVSAGAVIFPSRADLPALLPQVRDSKQMSPSERAYWAGEIRAQALTYAVGFASNAEIDRLGIVPATRLAMQRALAGLSFSPVYLLIDALLLPDIAIPQLSLIKGDARALSIAAASVLAKTARDAWMCEIASAYPGYEFARHKGYGTAQHRAALEQLGPCPIHRFSFAPLRQAEE
jgi:ribonuclease HII